MREIQASDAKTHLLRLLDEVEQGETLVITRHGRRIARVTPEKAFDQDAVARAKASIRALRQQVGRVTAAEILSARDEGRE
jgi:prevent-host-death family protein